MPNIKRLAGMDWNQLLACTRLGTEQQPAVAGVDSARTAFQRDFDRIVFSSALRRLQDKTQVFPLAQNDYIRTRLTHSLEVASVGRSLGAMVGDAVIRRHDLRGIDPQDIGAIVAAASLAHDIGNPPFGHAGEDAIRHWFQTSATATAILAPLSAAQQHDFLAFEGNAQGFRLLTRLQNPDNHGGLQLTNATLGAFSKYPCEVNSHTEAALIPEADLSPALRKFGFFQHDKPLFTAVAKSLGLARRPSQRLAWQRHPLAYLVEAADDICYLIIDIEDAFRLRRIHLEEALNCLLPLVDPSEHGRCAAIHGDRERIEFLRAKAIGSLIEQVYTCFMQHEAAILAGTFEGELLQQVTSAPQLQALQTLAWEKVYVAPEAAIVGAAGYQVLAGLLEAFAAATHDLAEHGPQRCSGKSRLLIQLMPEPFGAQQSAAPSAYQRLLGVTDFVSGMTDTYAVNLFKQITGISLPGGLG